MCCAAQEDFLTQLCCLKIPTFEPWIWHTNTHADVKGSYKPIFSCKLTYLFVEFIWQFLHIFAYPFKFGHMLRGKWILDQLKKDNYDKLNMLSALQPAWRCHLNSTRGRQSNAENVPDGPVGINKSSEETDWIISHNSNGNMSSIVERIHTYSEIVSEILTFSLQADFFLRRKPFLSFLTEKDKFIGFDHI